MGTVNIDAATIRTAIMAHATPSAIRAFLVRLFRSTARRVLKKTVPPGSGGLKGETVLGGYIAIINKIGLQMVNAGCLLGGAPGH